MQTPIKLAFCITELNVGGAERCLTQVATGLPRDQFAPIVYSLGPQPPAGRDGLVQTLREADVPVHFLDATGPRHAWRTLRRLTASFRQQRPDIVQTFLFHANLLGRIAARRAGVEQVVSGIRVAERRHAWHLWSDRWTQHWVRRHVCVSDDVARFSREVARLDPARTVVIRNGVDIERFDRAEPARLNELCVGADRKLITYVGRIDEQKRVDRLLAAAPRIFERLPQYDLLLVGDGPGRTALEAVSARAAWAQRVHWVGWRADVPEILRASELLVLASAWEGLPNVVLEAMAARLPVVATATEGVAEALGDGAEAQIVRGDDPQAFADRVVEILSDRALYERLAAANRARAEAQFDYRAMTAAYATLYRDLLRENA